MVKNQNLIFKSHHLVMNPGQGPLLKCAPGQDSIKDSSIIKNHCPKIGVMDNQNMIFWFGPKSGWGQILNRFAIHWPRTNLRIFWKFSNWYHPNQNHPTSWGLGCMLLGSRVVPNREFSEIFNLVSPLARWYQFENFLIFFRIFSKSFRFFGNLFVRFVLSNFFSRNRLHPDNSFGPNVVEIGAIHAIFRPFEIVQK